MKYGLWALPVLAACAGEANHLGNPLSWPFVGTATAAENAANRQRRGAVEVIVKSQHPAILANIVAGGGDVLTDAMNTAGVPDADRPARVLQMQRDLALYQVNPGALVVALMVYGNAPVKTA